MIARKLLTKFRTVDYLGGKEEHAEIAKFLPMYGFLSRW